MKCILYTGSIASLVRDVTDALGINTDDGGIGGVVGGALNLLSVGAGEIFLLFSLDFCYHLMLSLIIRKIKMIMRPHSRYCNWSGVSCDWWWRPVRRTNTGYWLKKKILRINYKIINKYIL